MRFPNTIRIPLHRWDGTVRAYALVDAEDADLAARRWCLLSTGYVKWDTVENGRRRTYLLHRMVLGLEHGDKRTVDHINRDRLDNRRENLRIATQAENNQNRPAYRGSTSQFRGVCWDRKLGKWKAGVRLNGRTNHVGVFEDERAAADAARLYREMCMPFTVEDGAS